MKSATGDLFQQYLFQSLIMTLVLHYSHGAANFVAVPAPKIYVIKGGVARFLWTYKVDQNRAYDLKPVSPIWFYGQYNQHEDIGGDNGYSGWEFGPFNDSCPERLRLPIVRVSRESQATLVIKDVILADSGEYGCRLEIKNPENTASPKSTSKLIVTVTPKFIAHAKAITEVVENKDLTLNCTAVGPPTPAIRWFDVTNNQNVGTNDKGSSILHIQNIKRHQNGTQFKCLASNNPNEGEIGTNVTTVIVYYPPEFTTSPENTTVTQGETIILHCQATSNPPPYIGWERENNKGIRPGFIACSNGTLLIHNARKEDAGNYICQAKNVFNSKDHKNTEDAFVTVRYQPTIVYNTSRHVVIEGLSVEMRCIADGYPKPNITWSKLSGSRSIGLPNKGEWYNISSIKKGNAGTYICTAENRIGPSAKAKITVIVQYKPTIDESESTTAIKSWNGNEITLTCKYSDANPEPTWTWKKPDGGSLTPRSLTPIDKGIQVTFRTGQDGNGYGKYKCIADNGVGNDEHTIAVTQLFPPGRPINVSVTNIKASSATVCWNKPINNGGSLVTGYNLSISGVGFSYSKSYNVSDSNVQQHDIYGLENGQNYSAKIYAINVVGNGNSSNVTFKTKSQGPPAAPEITNTHVNDPPLSVKLTWAKPFDNGGKITGYTIYKKKFGVDNKWKQVVKIHGSPVTYTVKNLEPGKTYKFIVTATNSFGESAKDDSKAKTVTIPVIVTTITITTLEPTEPSKGKSSGESDPNQPIIIAGAVVAVILILVTVIISVIILKKKRIFGSGKRRSSSAENAAYHNDVDSHDSSGRQGAVLYLDDVPTYAAVDKSKKTKKKPDDNATYAAVDKSKKKKKPGEIIYADLDFMGSQAPAAPYRPEQYSGTDYADITQFQNQSEQEPTYANFSGRSSNYANVSDI